MKGVWQWANEWDIECQHQPLPVNQSGVKVILAGWAKSGTWTMSASLGKLGLNSHHSQEFLAHVWSPLADDYWLRRSNRKTSVSTAFHWPLIKALGGEIPNDNLAVFEDLTTERLAERVSRCRVDAVALDGLAPMHLPLIKASPDVKVIMLDWRDYDGWLKSMANQENSMAIAVIFMHFFYNSLQFLPWGLLVKAIDPFINNDIEKLLKTGGPPFIQECPLGVMLWHPFVKYRQIYSHWSCPLSMDPPPNPEKPDFERLFKTVREAVPEKNILSWNFKTKGWEDLCGFLDIKNCPFQGRLKTEPNGYTDLWRNGGRGWDFNCDEPFALIPVYIVLHIINFKIFTAVLYGLIGLLRGLVPKTKAD